MLTGFENARRSNRAIFTYSNTGSPTHDLIHHISGRLLSDKPKDRDGGLGLNRLDFEFFSAIGKVPYKINGDATPVSQQDEEARLGTLAYGIKRLGAVEDAVEFIVCLIRSAGRAVTRSAAKWSPLIGTGKSRAAASGKCSRRWPYYRCNSPVSTQSSKRRRPKSKTT
jgi:hypothetical protein